MRSREEAEDLVQETYARIVARPRFLRNEDRPGRDESKAGVTLTPRVTRVVQESNIVQLSVESLL